MGSDSQGESGREPSVMVPGKGNRDDIHRTLLNGQVNQTVLANVDQRRYISYSSSDPGDSKHLRMILLGKGGGECEITGF